MPRRAHHSTPLVESGVLYTDDTFTGTPVGSPAWFTWLDSATCFYFQGPHGSFTAHRERRVRGGCYWIAYRRRAGVLHRCHLGKAQHLTPDRLLAVALTLTA
jgi:hypothetical protein